MKFFIWFLCFLAYTFLNTVLTMNGILLGAIPTAALVGCTVWVAHTLCKKFDESKKEE